jgi:uncharacterized RDD family membrane protein YckC
VYCPACGIKNDPPGSKCFICEQPMPSPGSVAAAPKGRERDRDATPRPGRNASSASASTSAGDSVGSVGDRMIAMVLDRILLASLLLIPAAFIGVRSENLTATSSLSWTTIGTALGGAFLIVFIYHFVLETSLHTTPGKAILGLYVRNESRRPNVAAVAIRNGLRIVDALALYLVGFLVALFSRKKQRFGDHIAATTVMERKLKWPARLALIALWISVIAASVWFANVTCPNCTSGLQAGSIPAQTAAR